MRISDWGSDVCSSDLHSAPRMIETGWLRILAVRRQSAFGGTSRRADVSTRRCACGQTVAITLADRRSAPTCLATPRCRRELAFYSNNGLRLAEECYGYGTYSDLRAFASPSLGFQWPS